MPSFAHPGATLEQTNSRGFLMQDVTNEILAASLLEEEPENPALSRPIERDATVAHQLQRLKAALEHGRESSAALQIDAMTRDPTRYQAVSIMAQLGPARLLEILELVEGSERHPHRKTLSALFPENADETTRTVRSTISELYRAVLTVRIFSGKRRELLLTIGLNQPEGVA